MHFSHCHAKITRVRLFVRLGSTLALILSPLNAYLAFAASFTKVFPREWILIQLVLRSKGWRVVMIDLAL